MPLTAGTRLGVFEILAPLGKGGMGEVYRAKDTKLGREVAVKVLPEALTQDPERLARFRREATLLAALNHPHVASIYGLEEADGNPFLVLELAPGENLSDRTRRGPIPVDETLKIARQIAEALEAAHEKGIVHRDLKPSNVKVTADGQVMVLDFGLAKAYAEDVSNDESDSHSPTMSAQATQAGVILGTAAYMSPEQAKGKPVDKRADIWAFGVLVWEMLTGRRLFAGDSVTDTLAAVLRADIDMEALSRSVPRSLVEVLHRCLERDPDNRLHDIADARLVVHDLEAGGWELPTAEAARSRGLPMGLAIGGLIGIALGAPTMWMLARPGEPRAPRTSRFEITIPNAVGARPAISPDGTKIAYASEGQLWVRELDRLEARVVTGSDGGSRPFWSPDGRSIGFSAEGAIWRLPVEGGTRTLLANESLGLTGTAVWMPGDRIFFTTRRTGIQEVSAVGGDSRETVQLSEDQADFHALDVLPNGKGFLTIVHKAEAQDFGNVTLITAERQTELVNVPGDSLEDPIYSETGHVVYQQQGGQGIAGIWAVPFSLGTLEVTGEPFVVARDARSPDVVADTLVYTPASTIHVNQLVWVDRSGRVLETVGEARKGMSSGVTLSPDGRRAAVSIREKQDWNLWVVDLESAQSTRVTFEEGAQVYAPAWTPNDSRLAYAVTSTGDDRRIMVKRPDGSTQAELVTEGGMAFDFSPDGKYMIFGRSRPGFLQDLWVRDLEDGSERAFVQNDRWDVVPSISPDGQFVAYRSGRAILVSRFPEADSQWQIAESGGYPKWSADGSRLYFFDGDDFMEVEIDPGPPFSAAPPVRLFSFRRAPGYFSWARGFAIDGNGERFLMVRVAGIPPGIVVYQNWLADLDR